MPFLVALRVKEECRAQLGRRGKVVRCESDFRQGRGDEAESVWQNRANPQYSGETGDQQGQVSLKGPSYGPGEIEIHTATAAHARD